jgi:protein involved in polysaccharide export with SLBB domain
MVGVPVLLKAYCNHRCRPNACLLYLSLVLVFFSQAGGMEGTCHAKTGDAVVGVGVAMASRVKSDIPEAPPASLPPNPGRAPAPIVSAAPTTVVAAGPADVSPVRPTPANAAPVGPVYAAPSGEITIQPDCLIQVKVEEDPALDGSYPVNELGAIELGYVGPVILFNMTEMMATQKIKAVLEARFFQRATVGVKIVRASYDKIFVGGGVNKPASIKIGAGDRMTLNDALLRAGGLKPSPSGAKVKVVRNGLLSPMPMSLEGEEYMLISSNGQPAVPSVFLKNNDVAYVFASSFEAITEGGEKEILVLGEVGKPGTYRFSAAEPCTMMHLVLDKLGGLPAYANKKDVKIIRRDRDGFEEEIEVNLEEILDTGDPEKDIPLEHGDRVVIPPRYLLMF